MFASSIQMRKWLLAVALATHGLLVLLSALKVPIQLGEFQTPIDAYRDASGAGNTYGFFAPGVAPQWRARAFVVEASEAPREVPLVPTTAGEAGHRFGVLMSLFQDASPENRKALARSWGAWVLARHPKATATMIAVEAFEIPTMERYRAGERPQWNEVFWARIEADTEYSDAGN